MTNSREVRIAYTQRKATFTQRGTNSDRGFIRVNGLTVTGDREFTLAQENVFFPDGNNSSAPYEGSW